MARPKKNTNHFPKWKPNWKLTRILNDAIDRKYAFKKCRNSSSAFIKRSDVRNLILQKSNSKCAQCSSKENLQVDHIESVLSCFKSNPFEFCNSYENLQILCKTCNTSKAP